MKSTPSTKSKLARYAGALLILGTLSGTTGCEFLENFFDVLPVPDCNPLDINCLPVDP